MRWIVLVVGGLVVLVAIVAIVGSMLPRNHVASRTLRVRRPPQDVWTAITQAMSASDVPVDIVESDPPRTLVSKVKETEKMFGGTWTVAIAPVDGGSTLTITEDGNGLVTERLAYEARHDHTVAAGLARADGVEETHDGHRQSPLLPVGQREGLVDGLGRGVEPAR